MSNQQVEEEPNFTDWAEDLTSSRENYGFDNYAALIEEALRKAYHSGQSTAIARAAELEQQYNIIRLASLLKG